MEDSAADNNHNIHSDDDHDEDDDCVDEPSVIRPIEEESVRRIVAGQAVTDLASCVKELVDNALDAGSKSINSTSYCSRSSWMSVVGSMPSHHCTFLLSLLVCSLFSFFSHCSPH